MNDNYLPNSVMVQVNGAVYYIPAEKYSTLLNLLQSWKTVQAAPQTLPQNPNEWTTGNHWGGKQIIND